MADRPLRVAVAGLGGFAGAHHAALEALEARGLCRVVATCDPDLPRRVEEIARFRLAERGVEAFNHLEAMLALEPDVVTLPTPIPLHAEQHAKVVAAGAACYLEKPPTLSWPEFRAMRRIDPPLPSGGEGPGVRGVPASETLRTSERPSPLPLSPGGERGSKATQVGFNFVGDPFRQRLKRRIEAGEFGPLREARFLGLWPRDRAYYTRNDWAGRLEVGDSPIGNAMAHYVQNLLFWAGGEVGEVRAWLARAHPIESYDTAFVAATCGGAMVRIGATHVGTSNFDQETLDFRDARIVFDSWRTARIELHDGRVERSESSFVDQGELLRHNLSEYFAYVRGERERPITSLADSEGFVALCALALVSAPAIEDYPATFDPAGRATVAGLEGWLGDFVDRGTWPAREPASVGRASLHPS